MTALLLHCFGAQATRELNRKRLNRDAWARAQKAEVEWKHRYQDAVQVAGGDLGKNGRPNAPRLRT